MKPLQHARITAHRHGGQWQDWLAFHDWIDRSKAVFPSMQHRLFLHSDFGAWLAEQRWGASLHGSDGVAVKTAELFHDHQVEDLGRIVPLAEWLREVKANYWSRRQRPPVKLRWIREDPATGLALRWGGVPEDYAALIAFFDKPGEFAPETPALAQMVTHNSFGLYLVEELLGAVLPLTPTNKPAQLVSTRAVAEDLVLARLGTIPPAGHLAAQVRLQSWMCGSEVVRGLQRRRKETAQ